LRAGRSGIRGWGRESSRTTGTSFLGVGALGPTAIAWCRRGDITRWRNRA
jgi:hypothetical protein